MAIPKVCGIETEYGVVWRGAPESSPVTASSLLINGYVEHRRVGWDFDAESPGRDARGFARDESAPPEVETHLVNTVLTNGARYYVDHAHPEYSTPECSDALELVAADKAGERILARSMKAVRRLIEADQEIVVYKNNSDGKGNSYGCHENYLVTREGDFSKFTDVLIPFLVTRQIYAGAGKVLQNARGAAFSISQRAEHVWEGVSSATTRSRPIINTRDEPHADAERFRRLHVIVGDSNMSEYSTFLKVGATSIMLRMLEEDGAPWRDLTLENPIRAIREISHDATCRRTVRLANGRELSALDVQSEYLARALRFARRKGLPKREQQALDMWEHCVTQIEKDPFELRSELDWVAKYHLIEAYRARHGLSLSSPRVALVDLSYHDVTRERSLYYLLERRGQMERMTTEVAIEEAIDTPPQTTRARLRGAFIKRAKERKRDYTVDWVHLKLNDQAQRTVLCKDPFKARDERVERLIAGL